jgi:hypothetical protein
VCRSVISGANVYGMSVKVKITCVDQQFLFHINNHHISRPEMLEYHVLHIILLNVSTNTPILWQCVCSCCALVSLCKPTLVVSYKLTSGEYLIVKFVQ